MGRKKVIKIPPSLEANTERAMRLGADDFAAIPANVWLPPTIRGEKPRVVEEVAFVSAPPSVRENIVRIHANCDPIGFLVAVANGQPIACFSVGKNGEINTHYEFPDLEMRVKVMRHLADRILPKMSLALRKGLGPDEDESGDRSRSKAIIERAAERSDEGG